MTFATTRSLLILWLGLCAQSLAYGSPNDGDGPDDCVRELQNSTRLEKLTLTTNEAPPSLRKLDNLLNRLYADEKSRGIGLDSIKITGAMSISGRHDQASLSALLGDAIQLRAIIPGESVTIVTFAGSLAATVAIAETIERVISIQGSRPIR